MNAEDLAQQLEQLGARLVVDGDRLMIDAPAGIITKDLRVALMSHKAQLLALVANPMRVNQGVDLRDDPRSDLAEDSQMWSQLLREAADIDYSDPCGLFGALYGVRCCGARLEATAGGWRIERPADMGMWTWEDLRAQWLVPHRVALRRLLSAKGA